MNPKPIQSEIAICAFFIWEAEGRPEGRQDIHWIQAEMQLEAARAHEQWASATPAPSLKPQEQ